MTERQNTIRSCCYGTAVTAQWQVTAVTNRQLNGIFHVSLSKVRRNGNSRMTTKWWKLAIICLWNDVGDWLLDYRRNTIIQKVFMQNWKISHDLIPPVEVSHSQQEAPLLQRNSASAAHVYLGWLADMITHSRLVVQWTVHGKIAEVVLFFDIQTLWFAKCCQKTDFDTK